MTLVTIRPGVTFEADSAASFQRLEAEVGTIVCNSTYRDPVKQDKMHAASVAYENGTGPNPGHSYAVASKDSYHCRGEAFDAARAKSIRETARRHGWVPVMRAGEEHHLERRASLDQYRSKPAPATTTPAKEFEDMPLNDDDKNWVRLAVRQEVGGGVAQVKNLSDDDKGWLREVVRQEIGGALSAFLGSK